MARHSNVSILFAVPYVDQVDAKGRALPKHGEAPEGVDRWLPKGLQSEKRYQKRADIDALMEARRERAELAEVYDELPISMRSVMKEND